MSETIHRGDVVEVRTRVPDRRPPIRGRVVTLHRNPNDDRPNGVARVEVTDPMTSRWRRGERIDAGTVAMIVIEPYTPRVVVGSGYSTYTGRRVTRCAVEVTGGPHEGHWAYIEVCTRSDRQGPQLVSGKRETAEVARWVLAEHLTGRRVAIIATSELADFVKVRTLPRWVERHETARNCRHMPAVPPDVAVSVASFVARYGAPFVSGSAGSLAFLELHEIEASARDVEDAGPDR